MKQMLAVVRVLVVGAGLLTVSAGASPHGLIVHEWGTFLAMNGSDGVTLEGMYHEEHALPSFVHARSSNELRLRTSKLKGETPVIYFYTGQPVRVQVEVGFPSGTWTQWYPQSDVIAPSPTQTGTPPRARDGRIGWTVDVVPPARHLASLLPAVPSDALWRFARDVESAYVSAADRTRARAPQEWERFLFYRGLGEARLPLEASVTGGGRLACGPDLTEGVRDVYLVRVEHGRGAYRHIPFLRCGEQIPEVVPAMAGAQDVERFTATIADDLASRLVAHGLYPKEARAMVNTWRTSYFEADGVRVLFVLPQSWTDRFIPMKVNPRPDELVRVMVGRLELLTPERERAAETAISRLDSPDPELRASALAHMRAQGRFVEPIVRRIMQSTTDARIRELASTLLP